MKFRYVLEKYQGGRGRHTCPACNRPKEFARYVDTMTGNYVGYEVGRCNRESRCGYHYTPSQFSRDNPSSAVPTTDDDPISKYNQPNVRPTSFITPSIVQQTLGAYSKNNLVTFLHSRFSDIEISAVVRRYLLGTWIDGRTAFWQIDKLGRIHTGKLMLYNVASGKRVKSRRPSWVHAELKRSGELSGDFRLRQCFFGEHLVRRIPEKAIGLVESEKTAIVASVYLPNYVWLASGGCGNLDLARISRIVNLQRVVLFPDSSKFNAWSAKADEARRRFGLNVKISDLFERRLTDEQKFEDYDIADFLLQGQASQHAFTQKSHVGDFPIEVND